MSKTEKLQIKVFLWNWNIAGIPNLVRKNGRRIDMTYKTDIWKSYIWRPQTRKWCLIKTLKTIKNCWTLGKTVKYMLKYKKYMKNRHTVNHTTWIRKKDICKLKYKKKQKKKKKKKRKRDCKLQINSCDTQAGSY